MPLSTYGQTDQSQNFNGAIGMHVGDSTIDEVGRVQAPNNSQYGQPGVERSVVIGTRPDLTPTHGLLVTRPDNPMPPELVPYPHDPPPSYTVSPGPEPPHPRNHNRSTGARA